MVSGQPVLISRDREIQQLKAAVRACEGGRGDLILVAGEAGIGKTALVEAALAGSDLLVLRGIAEPASGRPAAIVMEDLQEADASTLEKVAELSTIVTDGPLLILGIYRDDQLPRAHPLRRLRIRLRRAGRLHEVALRPLSAGETAQLAARVSGKPVTHELAALVYARTQGVPFFVEELAANLDAEDGEPPVPEGIRDAVRVRAEALAPAALRCLQAAAVAGERIALELLADLGVADGIAELVDQGFLVERGDGTAAFRRVLVREAVYADIAWTTRRSLHRAFAELIERHVGGDPAALAEHWLGAGDHERARVNLLRAAQRSAAARLYRDAAAALERAVQLWPEGLDVEGRLAAIEQLGGCAELAGNLGLAARAFEELSQRYRATGRTNVDVERRLASVCELRGAWELALLARERAAGALAMEHRPEEAAGERLAIAAHLQSSGRLSAALEVLAAAAHEVEEADDTALRARLLTLQGQVRAKLGEGEAGVQLARDGLALALDKNLVAPASDAYYRLASALEHAHPTPADPRAVGW